jgi:hypothetical protein
MCCIVGEREGSLRRLEGDVLMPSVAVADEDTTGKLTKSSAWNSRLASCLDGHGWWVWDFLISECNSAAEDSLSSKLHIPSQWEHQHSHCPRACPKVSQVQVSHQALVSLGSFRYWSVPPMALFKKALHATSNFLGVDKSILSLQTTGCLDEIRKQPPRPGKGEMTVIRK